MKERDRTRGQVYEAVNNEDFDEGDNDLEETKNPTKKGKFERTEPLSVRIVNLRNKR